MPRRSWLAVLAILLSGIAWDHAARAQAPRVPVVLLSIDGLKPDYVLEADTHGLKVPNLRRLVAEGAYATGVTGVTPTVTYPSHTTLVTGVAPARHGILNNRPFDPLDQNAGGWSWYAEDIKAPTLWDVAGEAGLVTANVDWPVTVGARIRHNIVQYWHGAPVEDHKLLRALSTPGLLDEAERDLGTYPAGYQYTLADDGMRAKFVGWMIEKKRPDLLTAYFSSLDEAQHHTAPYSPETFKTLEGLDALVGEVRAAAERAYGTRFVLSVVSDHGHITATREVHLNAALREAGLIDLDAQGKITAWRAYAWAAGGSAAIVLKNPADEAARRQVRDLLQRLRAGRPAAERQTPGRTEGRDASPGDAIARVEEGPGLRTLGGFPEAAFVIGLQPGFATGGAVTGDVVRPAAEPGGTHGYLPGPRDMESAFFIVGPGIPRARNLGAIDMIDIAPTLAGALGVVLPNAQGRNRL
jgi:predicted AlkP superfamily pyrophosphatase or phosphodiesterase